MALLNVYPQRSDLAVAGAIPGGSKSYQTFEEGGILMRRRHVPSKTHARGEEKRRKRQKGFTLIEMLAVVIILVIVAAIGFVVVNNQIEKSRDNTDKANVRTIADAVQRYILEEGKAPTSVDNLVPKYLARKPEDPWNGKKENTQYYSIKPENGNITITGINPANKITLEGAVPE